MLAMRAPSWNSLTFGFSADQRSVGHDIRAEISSLAHVISGYARGIWRILPEKASRRTEKFFHQSFDPSGERVLL